MAMSSMSLSFWVVWSLIARSDLAAAIKKSEEFRSKLSRFPPIESGTHRETKSFAAIMDETTGFME
jgi:beta-1,4-N-acetylglucosaminyltransferase